VRYTVRYSGIQQIQLDIIVRYHTDTEGWVPRTSLELPDTAHEPLLGQHTSHIVPHTDHSTHI